MSDSELASLRRHNTELLADLKKAKADAKRWQEQVATLTGERDEARGQVMRIKRDEPLNELFTRIAMPGAVGMLIREAQRVYDFDLVGDKIAVKDKDGKLAQVTDDKGTARAVEFTEADLRKLLSADFATIIKAGGASGTGAQPGNVGGIAVAPAKPASASAPVQRFGLC